MLVILTVIANLTIRVVAGSEDFITAPSFPRLASVLFTVRTKLSGYPADAGFVVATTRSKILLTLPPPDTRRPHRLTLSGRDIGGEFLNRWNTSAGMGDQSGWH